MTTLAIVGYPTLDPSDHRWIESLRARHDPQAARIAAHFTLVFPAELEAAPVVKHAEAVLQRTRAIPFAVRRAEPVAGPIAGGSHVFLVPEVGRDAICALHDRLYVGLLRPFLREGTAFVPHITVGGSAEFGECQRLAEDLNRAHFDVQGTIESIDLIEVTREGVKPVMRFALEPA